MKRSLSILLFFSSSIIFGQSFIIEGVVTSYETGEPLPFATLSLDGGTRGTIGNSSGAFRLVLKDVDRQDSLRISYVGYFSQTIKLEDITERLDVRLKVKEESLKEVVVTSLTAKMVLQNALERIDENYYQEAFNSRGFYRLTSRKNGKYVHLSEAVFDLYRSKVPKEIDLLRLDKMRAITDEREARGVDLGITPKGVFAVDEVNSKGFLKSFSKKKFLEQHSFVLEGEFKYDGVDVYLISFDQLDGVKELGIKGQFYIRKDDFAFLELDYGISPKSVQYFKFNVAYQALMAIFGIDIKLISENSNVRYAKVGEKYYLKDSRYDTDLRFRSKRSHYNFILNTRVDHLVTELNLDDPVLISKEEALPKGQLIEFQNLAYDSTFWNDYTIVLPDSDFSEISSVIVENNAANDTKKEVKKKLKKYPKDPSARIDSILTFYYDKGLFHGNALVSYNDNVLLTKSYPYQNQDINTDSKFRIGSVSKTFTSMLILLLEKEGKLKVSDPISKYLPGYIHGDVTIEQLLTHQSGIPNYLSKNEYLVDVFKESFTSEQMVNRFCSDSLQFNPGAEFKYSNSGYVILARIAELVGEASFGELLKKMIFEPLNMTSTYFGSEGEPTIEGYYYGQPETPYYQENVIGAGGIVSTSGDLLKWSKALTTNSLFDEELVGNAQAERVEYKDWEASYGYGWMIDRYLFKTSKKHKIVYHPGTDFAFYSMFLTQPDEDLTIVLLCNSGDFPRFEIADLILQVLN